MADSIGRRSASRSASRSAEQRVYELRRERHSRVTPVTVRAAASSERRPVSAAQQQTVSRGRRCRDDSGAAPLADGPGPWSGTEASGPARGSHAERRRAPLKMGELSGGNELT